MIRRLVLVPWLAAAAVLWAAPARADTVPDLVGLPEAKALDLGEKLGFAMTATFDAGKPRGVVFSQDPGGLAEREKGTTIRVKVGGSAPTPTPPPHVPPPVVPPEGPTSTETPPTGVSPVPSDGLEPPAVRPPPTPNDDLPPAGPAPTPTEFPPTGAGRDHTAPMPGSADQPFPPAETSLPPDVRHEPAPHRDGPEIPNTIQSPEAQARAVLRTWSVNVEYTLATPQLVGRVLNQIPYPGSRLANGEMVTIVVGIAELPSLEHYVVPMVEGGTMEHAQQELARIGFKPSWRAVPSTPDKRGLVVSQNPLPGSIAMKGTDVIVRLGTGAAKVPVVPPTPARPTETPPTPPPGPVDAPGPVDPPTPPVVQPPVVQPPVVQPPVVQPPVVQPPVVQPPVAPQPPRVLLGIPAPIAPAEGSTFPRNYGATFRWSPVQGAQRYELELQEEQTGEWKNVASHVVTETRFRPKQMSVGRFRWRVRALAGDAHGDWSAFFRLYMY